ncbi:MAG: CHASE domain-containing protein [Verrucomicrobiales bacterium]|nr:CHASE domain-containing protein [Verrucomicrobiales bacterium]
MSQALRQTATSSGSRLHPVRVGAALALGVLLSLALFFAYRAREAREEEMATTEVVHRHLEQLQVSILRSMEVLYSLAALHRVHGGMKPPEFALFVQQALARQPELQALSWNPYLADAERDGFERQAELEGAEGFVIQEEVSRGVLRRAARRSDYVPVYLIEPLSRNLKALGYDLNSDPVRRRSIEQACVTGKAAATAPIHLAQESGEAPGVLVLLPVYEHLRAEAETASGRRPAGFVVAVFRVGDLVGTVFRQLGEAGITADLFDLSTQGSRLHSNASNLGWADPASSTKIARLEVAGRPWVVVHSATGQWKRGREGSWWVLCGGMAFTLLTSAYLYSGARRAQEVALVNAALQQEVVVRQGAEAAAAEANRSKSEFLASMSHEIRTPLNAVLGYAQLLQRDPELSAEQQDGVRGITTSGQHLLGLINEILDLSKIEAGRMELNPVAFDLEALGRSLGATFVPLCAQKRIGFRLALALGPLKVVRGDEGKLRQVLINLLGNAVKFTQSGEVCLTVEPADGGGDRWHFVVTDTGLGIPESEQEDIFKPFHQGSGAGHQGGTGLGLAIAQRQVELLGGRLTLQSDRGAGSRFEFSVPLPVAETPGPLRPARIRRLLPGQRVRALVVDDRQENCAVLGGMLGLIGCEVAVSATVEDMLLKLQTSEFDILFLDFFLPGADPGETVRQALAGSRHADLKVVMHTASPLTRHREQSLAAGCVDFLAKPLQEAQVFDCLHRHLGVLFEQEPAVPEPETAVASGPIRVVLPEDLCARLMVAAELHSTTAMKSALAELRGYGVEAVQLADRIRLLMRSYDMDGIQRMLSASVVAEGPASRALPAAGDSDGGRDGS